MFILGAYLLSMKGGDDYEEGFFNLFSNYHNNTPYYP